MRHVAAFCLICGLAAPGPALAAGAFDRFAADIALPPIHAQRQDVREISAPPLPTGPANPAPFCQPANPVC
jgi:hypothetical protein